MSLHESIGQPPLLARQGRRLLQVGTGLLLFTSFWGFVFPHLASARLGLSAHRLTSLLAPLLLALGLLWPRLNLGRLAARTAFLALLYSSFAIAAAYVLGAVWGAGSETMTLAAHGARGSALQETLIALIAYSSAPTGIAAFALILVGLRQSEPGDSAAVRAAGLPESSAAPGHIMSARSFALLAAVLFCAMALLQFARAIGAVHLQIIIGELSLPLAVSWAAFAVLCGLALLGFRAATR